MSGLAGLWNLDGRPADRAIVGAMAAALAHRGPDHRGTWFGGPVGIACHLLRVTPESSAEQQPVTDDGGNALVFDGRLDNREELREAIGSRAATADVPDSGLALAAYREWGDGFLARLQGDFAAALFDSRRRTLMLARDPVGCRPLYYWTNERTLVFASEIKAILAHPDVRAKPNDDLIADFFLLNQLPYEDGGETFFDGVRAVLPGERMSVTPGRTRRDRFWDFDPGTVTRHSSYAEYADHLRGLLVRAVQRRARSVRPIAVSVSGGLDSAIVLCIADDLRRSGEMSAPLLPVSYTPIEDPTTEENRFIRLLESERGLRVHRVAMGPAGDAAELESAVWYSEFPLLDGALGSETPLLAYANGQGARIVLTGLWSDQLLFVTGYLADLFLRLDWRTIAKHVEEYKAWFTGIEPGYFRARVYRDFMLNLTPRALRSWLRPFRTALAAPRYEAFMRPEFAARIARRRPRIRHPRYRTAHARDLYQAVGAKSHRLQIEADEKAATRFQLERATPFLDRDVIAFLMSIPGDIQTRHGVPRALLRDAMRGRVPEAILARRWRNENTDVSALERARRLVLLATKTRLTACRQLGFCREARFLDDDSLELLGLEFWGRVFFSDKPGAP
jgi:asparagine synthase (glutamine-hydrolysing)